jgi:tRNA threonylcarbamoyladenosine biosynthesis protein TsaE
VKTRQRWQTVTHSPEATERLGVAVGAKLRGGEVIELVSDLGGGKTTFIRGLARGAGSRDHVTSPTFTISQEYTAGKLTLYHFDFYRLQEAGIMADELAEVVGQPDNVVVVEWGEIVQYILPEGSLTIKVQATDEAERQLTFTYPQSVGYLIEGLPAS